MEKKIIQLTQAFQHLRFQECLRASDQILKKMEKSDNKKKQTMSELDYRNLYLTRIGSLASLGQLHEANELINQKFKQPIISQQSSFLFLQICSLGLDRRLPQFVTAISETKQKKNIDINRFMLLTRKFSQLSRIFLRKYATSKKNSESFNQIYLQYLQQLQNQKMIQYRKDRVIKQNKALDLKFVSMFLQKFITNFKTTEQPKQKLDQSLHKKIRKSIADLKIKIAIHEGNSALVRKMFVQFENQIKQRKFVYLRSLKLMSSQREENQILWRKQFLNIFKNNLNLDNYQPIYDFSIQFMKGLIEENKLVNQLKIPVIVSKQQMYSFKQDKKQQVENYINSLFTQYNLLKQNEIEYKKMDYFKISLKNSLILLIYIANLTKNIQLIRKLLLDYKQQFGKKLTFCDQIRNYFNNADIFTSQFLEEFKKSPIRMENDEDKLIWVINCETLYVKDPLSCSLQENYKQWDRLNQLYLVNLKEVQKQKKLEKGQRYLSDQLLTIQADSIRKFTQQATAQQLSQPQRQQLYFYILSHLEEGVNRSPHNHDNKLRAIFFSNKLNYYEQSQKLLESLDIKAVQFETLGYFYLNNLITYCNWDQNQLLLSRMVRSYHQNYRQASEYAYKALLGISGNECQQNICYHSNINRSYNFLILLLVLYMKNKGKQNSQFYLKQIMHRIKQGKDSKLTFNADFKIVKNVVQRKQTNFVDFYSIYNSQHVLESECQIKLLLVLVSQGAAEEQIGELRKSIKLIQNTKQVYVFSEYEIFDKKLEYQYRNEQVHHEKITALHLRLNNIVNKLALAICDLMFIIKKQGNQIQQQFNNIKSGIKKLCSDLSLLSWRLQTRFLPSIRYKISEMIPVLATYVQLLSAKKKKVQGQAMKKQNCLQIIDMLINSVSQDLKMGDRLGYMGKIENSVKIRMEVFEHRDQMLDRITKMSANEYKKLYKIKL